ncbi:MAG: hypothetical protein H0W15_02250 [Gemmatimonadales bacterium]|nr:hypothetical protein [Gemmatimonadales bacterium]
MKARFTLAALATLIAAPLAAQGGGMRMGGAGQMNIESLSALYSLSTEQGKQTEEFLATYAEATKGVQAWMMKLRESGAAMGSIRDTPGFPDSMKKTTDARAKFDADFKSILVGTQVAKFDSVAAARAARMRPQG